MLWRPLCPRRGVLRASSLSAALKCIKICQLSPASFNPLTYSNTESVAIVQIHSSLWNLFRVFQWLPWIWTVATQFTTPPPSYSSRVQDDGKLARCWALTPACASSTVWFCVLWAPLQRSARDWEGDVASFAYNWLGCAWTQRLCAHSSDS